MKIFYPICVLFVNPSKLALFDLQQALASPSTEKCLLSVI